MQHGGATGTAGLARGRPRIGPPAWLRLAAGGLADRLLAERDRWLLWLPVAFGLGIAGFFALPAEPPLAAGLAAACVAAAAAFAAWRAALARAALSRALAVALAAASTGFAMAQARLDAVRAPVLPREATHEVTARVAATEPRGHGVRLVLDRLALPRLDPADTPERIRITVARGGLDLAPGDRVRVRARLQPPQGPALPGGFDYARQAYFDRLGGLGYAVGTPERLEPGTAAASGETAVASLRSAIAGRIASVLPGITGAFASALLVGTDAGIDARTWRDFQVSGLAHLVSISGLHMALVAGTVFGAARYGLALIPWLALRVRVHKPAAVLALLAAAGYALLAGNSVPTQRSFLSLAAALVAVMIDRNPLSLRLLAWAALAVLAMRPEALLGASFQLSFAAVLGLMAAYEALHGRLRLKGGGAEPLWRRPLRYGLEVALTTVIASTVTAPFAAYHFQSIATYGVLANLLAVPLTSFLVMPAGMLGLLLMPVGLDRPAFLAMGWGCDATLAIAHLVAMLPGASVQVTRWPPAVLILVAVGGLWLALWRRPWRLLGVGPCVAALVLACAAPVPALLVAPDLEAAARRLPDGRVVLMEWQRDARRRQGWLRALGVRDGERGPGAGEATRDGIACDGEGCILRVGERMVSLGRTAGAAVEDCGDAALTLSRAGPEGCAGGGGSVVGPRALRASAGIAVWEAGGGRLEVETVAGRRGAWPWSVPRPQTRVASYIN